MAIVTTIKQQVKRSDRYSIYLDGKYSFSLTDQQLIDSGLATGQELNEDQIAEFEQSSQTSKALSSAYNLLSYRGRSKQELTDRLSRKGYDEPTIELTLARLEGLGLADDQDFSQSWVSQSKSTNRSLTQLRSELYKKGIDSALIQESLDGLGSEHDEVAIKALIQKRLDRGKVDMPKLIAYLARRGFRIGQVKSVLSENFSEIGEQ